MWLKSLIKNDVLTNLFFLLVLVAGIYIYQQLPREQDPTINFNWVQVMTFSPGISAKQVEKQITDIIEESIEKIQDIKFVSSTSREGISNILVRFRDTSDQQFDKRVADLRREINAIEDQLPAETERPVITEITTSNAYPTATVIVTGQADDENLRYQANNLKKGLARIRGVDQVQPTGLRDPEIQIRLIPEKVEFLGISPTVIADTVRAFYRDVSAGSIDVSAERWLVDVEGITVEPKDIAALPLLLNDSFQRGVPESEVSSLPRDIRLGEVAEVSWARNKPDRLVRYEGKPAVLFAITKLPETNTLELVDNIKEFLAERNRYSSQLGVKLYLADDQTLITKNALAVMQTNALYGLLFVLLVTWLILGWKMSFLVTIGIPFTLSGTFIVVHLLGQTLNTSVLLAIVISLGMLVDDAVVVVESIHFKLRQGYQGLQAAWLGLTDVIKPVTSSVMTTVAAFLPLMLLPGILGKFMLVIPLVVTTALLISLVEAFWMLPGHIVTARTTYQRQSKIDHLRHHYIQKLQHQYGRLLVRVMRYPKLAIGLLLILFSLSIGAVVSGKVRVDFFASDTLQLFYINVTLPATSNLEATIEKLLEVEQQAREVLQEEEARSLVSYAGQMLTETAPLFGDNMGQVLVSLKPRTESMRSVEEIINALQPRLETVTGATVSILKLAGGPPTSKAISIKVRGDDFNELRSATDALFQFMTSDARFENIMDDDSPGGNGLILTLNSDAIRDSGISPTDIQRVIRIMVGGEVVSFTQHEGSSVAIRVGSLQALGSDSGSDPDSQIENIQSILNISLSTPSGSQMPLSELIDYEVKKVKGNIRHYNFVRTITLEADINKDMTDTVSANALVLDYWSEIATQFPNVSLDFTGELDDIQESINAIALLFLFGIGLIYIILSTQFQSYFQPLMILVTVPLAFTGVILGLIVSNNPLSLYTLYGVVALAGISVNAAIVLISKANQNLRSGMTLTHATFYAARRRMLPILITTVTTIAGLFSLATGLGGQSLLWAPVAIAIVWGLMFSATLTLFVIPVIYQTFMPKVGRRLHDAE